MGLTSADYADYELLQTIENEPKSTTGDIANVLDRELRAVASRLSWMMRMGLAERTIGTQTWLLTRQGREMLNGHSEDILAIRQMASSARRSESRSWVLRREFKRDF
jgi:hypothetical protein